jgi:type I restriction enzyme M protein
MAHTNIRWNSRDKKEHACRLPVERIIENGYNLYIKNPTEKEDFEHLPPEKFMENIVPKEQRILGIMCEIQQVLAGGGL